MKDAECRVAKTSRIELGEVACVGMECHGENLLDAFLQVGDCNEQTVFAEYSARDAGLDRVAACVEVVECGVRLGVTEEVQVEFVYVVAFEEAFEVFKGVAEGVFRDFDWVGPARKTGKFLQAE